MFKKRHIIFKIFVILDALFLQDFGRVASDSQLLDLVPKNHSHGRHPFVQQEDLRPIFWLETKVQGPVAPSKHSWFNL